ncbi:hypothetical protein JHK82_046399 [Glycine max]|nr:hypothetical protein JHK85_046840 [Glycine max]KAG5096545.1 hypothetical protein JHK82_046399 [Glycine max]
MDKNQTKLEYFDEMWRLQCTATLLSHLKEDDDGRHVLILDRTIFYPQGGGQPPDTGFLLIHGFDNNKFLVFHYGFFENLGGKFEPTLEKGKEVSLFVDEFRRKLNSRLHSAGHLLKICLPRIGLGNLESGKAYHFPDGLLRTCYCIVTIVSWPWVEYKGTISQNQMQSKQKDLELEANALISVGGKVSVDILPYDEAAKLCGGCLPDYVPKHPEYSSLYSLFHWSLMLKFSVGQKIHAYGVLSTLNFVEVLISHKYEIFFLKMEEILFPVIVKVIKSFQALISVSVKEYNCFPFAAFLVCQCVFVSCQIGDNPRINSHVADISDIKQIKV